MVRILVGDVRDRIRDLPDKSVQCVVTSPPYFGLRDYGTAEWEGGDSRCMHEPPAGWIEHNFNANCDLDGGRAGQSSAAKRRWFKPDGSCPCGARRIDKQIGLVESTPDEYVANLVAVMREVRRVLRDDGVMFLNLGDSYNSGAQYNHGCPGSKSAYGEWDGTWPGHRALLPGLKPKDLIGIPWRVAFALRADGWYLRSDIVWAKPNPMPESVTDRPTKSHEYVFLLSKRATYYYDAESIAEPSNGFNGSSFTSASDVVTKVGLGMGDRVESSTRNARSVWTIATQAYPEAHFATFPEELARRCILAGTSQRGCCPECGAPWERVVERGESSWKRRKADGDPVRYGLNGNAAPLNRSLSNDADRAAGGFGVPAAHCTTGWRPTCNHTAEPVPCVVLDPFGGSGTVGAVAVGNGRDAVLIELNPDYIDMARRRIGPMFAEVV